MNDPLFDPREFARFRQNAKDLTLNQLSKDLSDPFKVAKAEFQRELFRLLNERDGYQELSQFPKLAEQGYLLVCLEHDQNYLTQTGRSDKALHFLFVPFEPIAVATPPQTQGITLIRETKLGGIKLGVAIVDEPHLVIQGADSINWPAGKLQNYHGNCVEPRGLEESANVLVSREFDANRDWSRQGFLPDDILIERFKSRLDELLASKEPRHAYRDKWQDELIFMKVLGLRSDHDRPGVKHYRPH